MLSQTTLRDGDGMVSFEIIGAPPTDGQSSSWETGGLVFCETCPSKCDLAEPDERGKSCPIAD